MNEYTGVDDFAWDNPFQMLFSIQKCLLNNIEFLCYDNGVLPTAAVSAAELKGMMWKQAAPGVPPGVPREW